MFAVLCVAAVRVLGMGTVAQRVEAPSVEEPKVSRGP
jgi:hypothetical protein